MERAPDDSRVWKIKGKSRGPRNESQKASVFRGRRIIKRKLQGSNPAKENKQGTRTEKQVRNRKTKGRHDIRNSMK
jgi:hypothetical protein